MFIPYPYISYHILNLYIILQCEGYDINSPTDWVRRLWRQRFAEDTSPFNMFTRDFAPSVMPSIARRVSTPEIFYFTYNDIAVFGLNLVSGSSYEMGDGPVDEINSDWVSQQLGADTPACSIKSIILVAHMFPSSAVNAALDTYFETCGILPTLAISGNDHPKSYCFNYDANIAKRINLTVEAYESGPIRVSVLRDPNGDDYFHVDDSDLANSNSNCPDFM